MIARSAPAGVSPLFPKSSYYLLDCATVGDWRFLALPLYNPLKRINLQCAGVENILGRVKPNDCRVVLHQRVLDDQVSVFLAVYHLLLEAVEHIDAHDRVIHEHSNYYHFRINRSVFMKRNL
jgi:hypothetical protein